MTDIKTRLREGRTDGSNLRWTVGEIHIEAADTIASLERRLEDLEGAAKCGCSLDRPDDVCMFHAAKYAEARHAAVEDCIAKVKDYALDAQPDSEYALACRDLVEAFEEARRALSKGTGE